MKKKWLTIGAITIAMIGALILAFYSFNAYIYQQKQGSDMPAESYRATLSGTYTHCLPRQDAAKSDSCVAALQIEDGSYYAIDFNLFSVEPPELRDGDYIRAVGMVTPIDMLSSDHLRTSGAVGVFSVTDSLEVF